ncbi:hypothetical protein U0070_021498 [Myodes glareolus]|uniref:Cystatin kininogen-type domain-containing protein n=1 Tax=Myodes glareolus TaxID=447135 RepID=A0AAW0JDD1_MYOGA
MEGRGMEWNGGEGNGEEGDATVYYFVLDVKESDCWVLSTKSQNDCLEASRPSEIVAGQCKVIATRYSNDSQDFRENNYNCTASSGKVVCGIAHSRLTSNSIIRRLLSPEQHPVLLEYIGESEVHRQQAHNALEKYKEENDGFASFRVDRVERVIKAVFGFCRAVLSYSVDATYLETPENIDIISPLFLLLNLETYLWLLLSLAEEETTQKIDCNDEDVFHAVDAALKKYNAGNQSGNQFVLYRVMEGTKMVGSDTFYSFKYQIKEGNCPVQSGLTWQDCDYKDAEEAATGECTATVGKSETNIFYVVTQTCNITPDNGPVLTAQYSCKGCVHPIPPDSPELESVLKHAVKHFNVHTTYPHFFVLKEVKAAQRQDVWKCRDIAFVDIDQKISDFSQNCNIYSGKFLTHPLPAKCPGCPSTIPVDSPELTEPLGHAIKKVNLENNHISYFKIDKVKKVTSQVCKRTQRWEGEVYVQIDY